MILLVNSNDNSDWNSDTTAAMRMAWPVSQPPTPDAPAEGKGNDLDGGAHQGSPWMRSGVLFDAVLPRILFHPIRSFPRIKIRVKDSDDFEELSIYTRRQVWGRECAVYHTAVYWRARF